MIAEFYPWLLAAHIAAVILFISGLTVGAACLGIADEKGGTPLSPAVLRALARWDRRVTTPAMLVVWILGLTLAMAGAWFPSGWLVVKLVFVLLLSGIHGMQSGSLRRLQSDPASFRPRPRNGALVIGSVVVIVFLAVLKPF